MFVYVCSIPFCLTRLVNSSLVKADPLSETPALGSPCVANTFNNCSMVVAVVALLTGNTSNHLECVSMITKNISGRDPHNLCGSMTRPGVLCPLPCVEGALAGNGRVAKLTLLTRTYNVFQLCVQVWPPNISSC